MDVDDLQPLESTVPDPTEKRRLSELIAEVDSVEPPEDDDNTEPGTCMICGLEGECHPVRGTNGVFSGTFTTDYGLDYGDGICYRCRYMAKEMDYRRYHWLATEDGVQIIKERPDLIDALLDPPEGPWMCQYKDGSDFLTVLNGWIVGQSLNRSRDTYSIIVDKQMIDFERDRLETMIDFGRELRDRDDAISKRALKHGPTAGDLGRYDLSRDEYAQIAGKDGYDGYSGREDWRIAVQLIE